MIWFTSASIASDAMMRLQAFEAVESLELHDELPPTVRSIEPELSRRMTMFGSTLPPPLKRSTSPIR